MSARSQNEQDLRATSDSIREDAERLADLEAAKSAIEIDDPQMKRLSSQVVQLADDIKDKAEAERDLAQSVDRENEGRAN
ncbi:MAG: hypothetical protein ABI797_06080 [Chloroflexota bacterium]